MVHGLLDELEGVLDRLAALEADDLASSDDVERLHRVQARVEAVTARATARWDLHQEWAADDARSGAAWLAGRCRLPKAQARRCLRLGRTMRDLTLVGDAWLAGDIGAAQVTAIGALRNVRTSQAVRRDEAMLVGFARDLWFDDLRQALDYWRQRNDPDGSEQDQRRLLEQRRLDLSQTSTARGGSTPTSTP